MAVKKFENKSLKGKGIKVKKEKELINYYFPDHQRSIKATSLEEATKKINSSK